MVKIWVTQKKYLKNLVRSSDHVFNRLQFYAEVPALGKIKKEIFIIIVFSMTKDLSGNINNI